MPSNPSSGPEGPAWRKNVKPAAKKEAAQPLWKRQQEKSLPEQRSWTRRNKLGVGVTLLFALTGLLVWAILLLQRHRPGVLVLMGAGYETNLAVPHNVYGWRSLVELRRQSEAAGTPTFFGGSGNLFSVEGEPLEINSTTDWARRLAEAGKRREDTIILYLALHGAADEHGPFFFRGDVTAQDQDRERGLLRLKEVLDELGKLDPKKNKLLILDATQLTAIPTQGILRNDFARALVGMEEELKKVPNLLVLSASDRDQRSWVSDEFGHSVFAHFLIEGLRGAAESQRDGRISVAELHDYLTDKVASWAQFNRLARQTPVLLGDRTLAERVRLSVVDVSQPIPEPATSGTFNPDEVRPLWLTCRELERLVPAPVVYSPHKWRRYQDLLLRYEELSRAGDSRGKEQIQQLLTRLEHDLRNERAAPLTRELACIRQGLAIPAALGLNELPLPTSDLAQLAGQLWLEKKERNKLWEKLEKDPRLVDRAATGRPLLQQHLTIHLLEQFYQEPEEGARVIETVFGKGNARPVEVHFLRLLRRGLEGLPRSKELNAREQQALRLRALAERAALAIGDPDADQPHHNRHPYSEYVVRWIRPLIDAADQQRRLGEDHVFSGTAADLETAGKLLRQAEGTDEAGYKAALRQAAAVREAYQVYQQALHSLPYYSQWAARGPVDPRDDAGRREIATLVRMLEDLWDDVHYLARHLEEPTPTRIDRDGELWPGDRKGRSLQAQTQQVSQALQRLRENFQLHCQKLAAGQTILQSRWRELDDALLVPHIDPELRQRLLERLLVTGQELQQSFSREQAQAIGLPDDKLREAANDQGYWQARLVLAALGERWFGDPRFKEARLTSWIKARELAEAVRTDPDRGWEQLRLLGEEIGKRRRKLPAQIADLVGQARQARASSEAETLLGQAERLTRQLDGGLATVLDSANPVQEHRKLLLAELLTWLAERTYLDYWWGEDYPRGDAYYQVAARQFLRGAEELLEGLPSERQVKIHALKQKINLSNPVELRGAPQEDLQFIPGEDIGLDYRLVAADPAALPEGRPALWVRPQDPRLELLEPGSRRLIPAGSSDPVRFKLAPRLKQDSDAEACVQLGCVAQAWYRGRLLHTPSPLTVHLRPHAVTYQPPAPAGSMLAVRADDELHELYGGQKGAIAIVLDCSGSMVDNPEKFVPGQPSRWTTVLNILETVLKTIKDGVSVSVWVYGHDTGVDIGRGAAAQLATPIEQFRPPKPWSAKERETLLAALRRLRPYWHTPLVKAMSLARQNGFRPGQEGRKTLLVLTDGDDTAFEVDTELQAKHNTKDISKWIEAEFKNEPILINFVAFTDPATEAKVRQQFQKPLENLKLKGFYFDNLKDDPKALQEALVLALKQELRYQIFDGNTGKPLANMPEEGELVTRSGLSEDWKPLRPGLYRLVVQTDRKLEQDIRLNPADNLLVNVRKDTLTFERVVYTTDRYESGNEQRTSGSWVLGLMHNRFREADRSAEFLITLENQRAVEAVGGILSQLRPRPGAVWIEVQPVGSSEQPEIRVGDAFEFPGPSWLVTAKRWPIINGRPALPHIQAWWNAEEDVPSVFLPRAPGGGPTSLKTLSFEQGGDLAQHGTINRMEFKRLRVPTALGLPEELDCLVVQATFPRGNPVWVKPEGINIRGQEHRFYLEARKYEGIFYSITREQAAQVPGGLTGLRILFLQKFKEQKTTEHIVLTAKNPPNPRALERNPVPIQR